MTTAVEPDVKGTFYCQAGDHIVDHVVWLESITLGCRPCMTKLGTEISRDGWIPRLWSVTPTGTRLAKPIARPKKSYATPSVFREPMQWHGSQMGYNTRQDWVCTVCEHVRDEMDGFYNTEQGFVCKCCSKTRSMDHKQTTPLQRQHAEDRQRRREIAKRQADEIVKMLQDQPKFINGKVIKESIEQLWPHRDEDVVNELIAILQKVLNEPKETEWPEGRRSMLASIPGLQTVQGHELPAKGKPGDRVYVIATDKLYIWMDVFGWVQVGMPTLKDADTFTFTPQTCRQGEHAFSNGLCITCGSTPFYINESASGLR